MAENQAAKDHSAVLRADFQVAAYPPGVSPVLGKPRASQQCYGIFFAQTQHRKQTAIRFFYAAKRDIIGTQIGLQLHFRDWMDNFVSPMNPHKFVRVEGGVSQNGQPRRLLVKHFCETNVGCSFLSGQSRFAYLESNGRQFCPLCNALKNDRVQNHYPDSG